MDDLIVYTANTGDEQFVIIASSYEEAVDIASGLVDEETTISVDGYGVGGKVCVITEHGNVKAGQYYYIS